MHRQWLVFIGLSSGVALALADDLEKQSPTPASLAKVVTAWQQTMLDPVVTTRLTTLDAMSPTAKDVAVMFPQYAEKLGRFVELIKRRQADGLASARPEDLAAERAKQQKIKRVRALDVRTDKGSKNYEAVLKLLPANLPVYRVVIEYEMNTAGSSSYVFVNDRWIYFRDLKAVPELLPKLDMVLQQLEKQP